MEQLRGSRYVLDVTQSIVHFSAQFKALFYEGLQAGKAPAEIVLEHEIDPEILGTNWVNGLKVMVLKEAKAERGYTKGARGIYMRLIHMDPPVVMNIKKIRRLMRKYGLKCPIRKADRGRPKA